MDLTAKIAANKQRQEHIGIRIIRVNFPTSRKRHECVVCGEHIENGEQYVRAEYVGEWRPDILVSTSSHIRCNSNNVFIEYAVDCVDTLPANTPFIFTSHIQETK